MEIAILARLNLSHPHLIKTGLYQNGLKYRHNTAVNLTELAIRLRKQRSHLQNWRINLFVGLQKAYDSVNRVKMFEVLEERCSDDSDRAMT